MEEVLIGDTQYMILVLTILLINIMVNLFLYNALCDKIQTLSRKVRGE